MKKFLAIAAVLVVVLAYAGDAVARSFPDVGGYRHVTQVNRAVGW